MFDPASVKFESIDFDLKKATISNSTPLTLASQTLENDTNYDQEMSFEVSQTVTGEMTFTYTSGMSLTTGFTFNG